MNEFERQLKSAIEKQETPNLSRQIWLRAKEAFATHQRRRIRGKWISWSVAASVLVVFGLTFCLKSSTANMDQMVLQKYGLDHYGFPQEVERRMTALIATKIPRGQVESFDALKNQMYFLNKQYQNYLEYINENGYQEYIGKQIQNYYEVKIELLEKIQKEIQNLKTKTNESTNGGTDEVSWQI